MLLLFQVVPSNDENTNFCIINTNVKQLLISSSMKSA